MLYRDIELDYTIEQNARADIKELITQGSAEMNPFQHAFIAGLIKKYRPTKILEIGIAAGGTTCFLHECLKRNRCNAAIYSVDKYETYYRVPSKKTGYLLGNMSKCKGYEGIESSQNTIIGQSIPFVIEQINNNIDFLLLDTTHCLPGELLDFLICLPFLKIGATVVLHDTICNLINNNGSIATKLLFDVVKADKICVFNKNEDKYTKLPNIMAFVITEETKENAIDILSALTLDWQYELDECETDQYARIIQANYGDEFKELYMGIDTICTRNMLSTQLSSYFNDDKLIQKWKLHEKPVLVYGNGFWATKVLRIAKIEKLMISAMIVSDDQDISKETKRDIPIYKLSEIPSNLLKLKVIYALDVKYRNEIECNAKKIGLTFL